MIEYACPKKDKRLKKMMEDGTIFCYLTHVIVLRCSDVACCEDCPKVQSCPMKCKGLREEKAGYIQ